MEFKIDIEKFKKQYNIGSGILKHNHSKSIKILPYITKYDKKHKEQNHMNKLFIGEFSRLMCDKKLDSKIDFNEVDLLIEGISCKKEDKIYLKSIIKELFFDNDNLITFHPKIFNYINANNGDYNLNLAKFLYDVLLNGELSEDIEKCFDYSSNNILEILVLNGLPQLTKSNISKEYYKNICRQVSTMFKEDFIFLIENQKLFIECFENLLKYYYFFYVSQLALKTSKMFDTSRNSIEELYFNVEWESVSKTRNSYLNGWKMLDNSYRSIFSHINTLEILNINDEKTKYDYIDIKEISEDDLLYSNKFLLDIENVKHLYKNSLIDINWDNYKSYERYENNIKKEIYDLFLCIDYQFKNSTRNKPYNEYRKFFEDYCKDNFLKRRGSLGYTLNMTQENLIFLTKLAIKDKDKIKLNDLFKEYEKRGVFFDRDSKSKIIELFEKLNIIEKKSDSGDAQYVKSIL